MSNKKNQPWLLIRLIGSRGLNDCTDVVFHEYMTKDKKLILIHFDITRVIANLSKRLPAYTIRNANITKSIGAKWSLKFP